MLEIVRGHREREPMTASGWAAVLGEALEDRFRDRSGGSRSDRARATIVGALFTEYADARFEVDGVAYRLERAWPEGTGRPAVWGVCTSSSPGSP
jgi:hypothetical protein